MVFAGFSAPARAATTVGGTTFVQLPDDAPMRREWAVVCDAPDYPAMLTAWELPGPVRRPGQATALRVHLDRRARRRTRRRPHLRAGGPAVRARGGGPAALRARGQPAASPAGAAAGHRAAQPRRRVRRPHPLTPASARPGGTAGRTPPPRARATRGRAPIISPTPLTQEACTCRCPAVGSSPAPARSPLPPCFLVLSGCAGFTKSDDSGGGGGSTAGTLKFTTWGSDAEAAAFKQLARAFETANKGATVDLKIVPYGEMFTGIDAQLQAGTAPDIFRVDYTTHRRLQQQGRAARPDLVLDSVADRRPDPGTPPGGQVRGQDLRRAAADRHHRRALPARAARGRRSHLVPDSLDDAWTWEEFGEVADKLKASLDPKISPSATTGSSSARSAG